LQNPRGYAMRLKSQPWRDVSYIYPKATKNINVGLSLYFSSILHTIKDIKNKSTGIIEYRPERSIFYV
jgi:hypothetical protein